MNIQGANLLSLLAGPEGVGNLQQSLLGGAGDEAGFASAFMQQLGLLQGTTEPDMAAMQNLMQQTDLAGGLQNFADLMGKHLPLANTPPTIDLDETLQTLADVMQQLQQLQQLEPDTQLASLVGVELPAEGTRPAIRDALLEHEEIPADMATMPVMPMVLQGQPPVLANQDLDVPEEGAFLLPPTAEAESQTQDSVLSLLNGADAAALSETVPSNPAFKAMQTKSDSAEPVILKADELNAEFDRSMNSLLASQAGAESQSQSQSQSGQSKFNFAQDAKLDTLAGDLETQSTPVNPATHVMGDIEQMQSVLRRDAQPALPITATMQRHLTDPGWHQELGNKLIWMHKQALPSVELRLNPEHLGPVLVKIDIQQDQASVAFTAQHLAVKEAIEAALPKLREMLTSQQLNLVDVNVSQQQADQRQSAREFFQQAGGNAQSRLNADEELAMGAANEAQDIMDEIEAGRAIASNGLLSLFA